MYTNFSKMTGLSILLLVLGTPVSADDVTDSVLEIQHQWADIKYQQPDQSRVKSFEDLIKRNELLVEQFQGRAEPRIWLGINLSSYAGELGGLRSVTKALPAVKRAKQLLEQAESMDAGALDGAAVTTLAVLYAETPGWPVGFGSKKKARECFRRALELSPNGLDSNYFYGKFLLEEKSYDEAVKHLQKSLDAPDRPNRSIADAGRKAEAANALVVARNKLG